MSKFEVKLTDLSLNFNNENVLKNINLKLESAKSYLLFGRNGAGKTSLFNCLLNFNSNYTGSITIQNDKKKYDLLKKTFLPELFVLSENVVVKDYVKSFLELLKLQKRFLPGYNKTLQEKFLLTKFDKKTFGSLSKGMKKVVFLNLALSVDADLIILDEPFEGLDIVGKDNILKIINSLKEDGKLVLVSTHEFYGMHDKFDELICLKDGEIISDIKGKRIEDLVEMVK